LYKVKKHGDTDPHKSQQIMYPSSCWKSQIHLVTLSSPTAGSPVVVVVETTTSLMPAADASAVEPVSSSCRPPRLGVTPPPSLDVGDGGARGDSGGVHGKGAV